MNLNQKTINANSSFLQSLIIVFCMTVFSNVIYSLGKSFLKSLSQTSKAQPITEEVVSEIEVLIQKEINLDISEAIGVFLYQDDFNTREKFEANTFVNSPVITDLKLDPEYNRMIDFHQNNICYQQNGQEIDKTSKLYEALLSRPNLIVEESYYTSCPIFVNNKLIGYLGSFYTLDVPGRPSIRISRLRYLSYKLSEIFNSYL